jgi:Holliday junction resolvase RusA-like endonuclease
MAIYRVEIPLKLPSCNQYIGECRKNRFAAAKMKSQTEQAIGAYIQDLPHFEHPVKIRFFWIEENKRRDLDGTCFGKKFILDALVKYGKLTNDNRKYVTAFTDDFGYGDTTKVILTIEEVSDGTV